MNSKVLVESKGSQNKIHFTSLKAKLYTDYDSTALDFICMHKCMELELRIMKKREKMNSRNQISKQLTLTI
jgi:hypothetical protein